MTDAPRAYRRHLRALKICHGRAPQDGKAGWGSRGFWHDRGWDWQDFIDNGILTATLRATGDAQAIRVADLAESDIRNG